jgi:hypothetical protein
MNTPFDPTIKARTEKCATLIGIFTGTIVRVRERWVLVKGDAGPYRVFIPLRFVANPVVGQVLRYRAIQTERGPCGIPIGTWRCTCEERADALPDREKSAA